MKGKGINRQRLRAIFAERVSEFRGKTYLEMKNLLKEEPVSFSGTDGTAPYYFKIYVLEDNPKYLHVAFNISAKGWSTFFPEVDDETFYVDAGKA